ncbi:N-acyl-D-amino-acid deacylase family protein [Steroidobacter sp.]|uniref:N-acyl-D-amino-acid deacylase family protein n=1 Tax=Steroidobacter sp. TaxID=1978227 RepID=UPI001A5F4E58|nr:D-aminoacylase [Steroidobacter sp.]MBL8267037.1 D-aminoacylase [Steroidobacter sp.]
MKRNKRQLWLLAICTALTQLIAPTASSQGEVSKYDVLIRGARVLDGTGTPWFYADVAIKGDRIAAVGKLTDASATRTIDATGKYLAPGFIDAHSHAWPALGEPKYAAAEPLLTQGITTVAINPDGGGPTDLRQQRVAIEAARPGVNVAMLVPHNNVRVDVLGYENRAPTAAELSRMQALVRRGMEEGAYGLSAGPFYTPGNFSKTEEHIELAKVAAEFDGIYTSHIRDESRYNIGLVAAVEEVITIAREARLPGIVTHIKASTPACWGMSAEVIQHITAARAAGIEVLADHYPYEASATSLASLLVPAWAREGGNEGFQKRLRDKAQRARIRAEMAENLERRGGAGLLLVSAYAPDKSIEGLRLDAIAKQRGRDAVDTALELISEGSVDVFSFTMSDQDLRAFMAQPWTMTSTDGELMGEDDGIPHPRAYGTFPRKLRRYVFDESVLTLEQAVHSMTGLTATTLRLRERGEIRPGAHADLVVFDPAIRDHASYEHPKQLSSGMSYVIVNGELAIDAGRLTPTRVGRVLSKRAGN